MIEEKILFECEGDEFQSMSLAEMYGWLAGLADGQQCGPDEITFKITQHGDSWDGYDRAKIEVVREETSEEAADREAKEAADRRTRDMGREAAERLTLQRLAEKYGTQS